MYIARLFFFFRSLVVSLLDFSLESNIKDRQRRREKSHLVETFDVSVLDAPLLVMMNTEEQNESLAWNSFQSFHRYFILFSHGYSSFSRSEHRR